MRLIHYSEKPLIKVESQNQDSSASLKPFKPKGLWVSVEGEGDWKKWCESENFSLNRLTHSTEIILTPNANILHISTPQELRTFSDEYSSNEFAGVNLTSKFAMKWDEVAKLHQGIIIAPHQWGLRMNMDLSWYYTWDCASGCIWDASAVAELRNLDD